MVFRINLYLRKRAVVTNGTQHSVAFKPKLVKPFFGDIKFFSDTHYMQIILNGKSTFDLYSIVKRVFVQIFFIQFVYKQICVVFCRVYGISCPDFFDFVFELSLVRILICSDTEQVVCGYRQKSC